MKVPHWRFSCFLNCTKDTKSRNMSRIPSYLKKWQKTNEFPSYTQVNRNRMLFSINPIQMVFFGAAHGWGAKKVPPPSLKSVTHIIQWWNLAVIPYLKKIQKLYESRDTPLEFCWHQHFLIRNQQILLCQEIQI